MRERKYEIQALHPSKAYFQLARRRYSKTTIFVASDSPVRSLIACELHRQAVESASSSVVSWGLSKLQDLDFRDSSDSKPISSMSDSHLGSRKSLVKTYHDGLSNSDGSFVSPQ